MEQDHSRTFSCSVVKRELHRVAPFLFWRGAQGCASSRSFSNRFLSEGGYRKTAGAFTSLLIDFLTDNDVLPRDLHVLHKGSPCRVSDQIDIRDQRASEILVHGVSVEIELDRVSFFHDFEVIRRIPAVHVRRDHGGLYKGCISPFVCRRIIYLPLGCTQNSYMFSKSLPKMIP